MDKGSQAASKSEDSSLTGSSPWRFIFKQRDRTSSEGSQSSSQSTGSQYNSLHQQSASGKNDNYLWMVSSAYSSMILLIVLARSFLLKLLMSKGDRAFITSRCVDTMRPRRPQPARRTKKPRSSRSYIL